MTAIAEPASVAPAAPPRQPARLGRTILAILFGGALFLLAFWPRQVGLDVFVTTDEIFWAGRSGNFAQALASGRLAGTFQTGHPGVTTMWLGLLGMGPERAQALAGDRREVARSQVVANPRFLPALADARRQVALATALATALCALLAWRLFGPGAAALGGALLALDPFFLAHSQLLHLDALLASFTSLALLGGLGRWLAGGGRGYLALSAIATGLAVLTKAPALLLLGLLPGLALLAGWRGGRLAWRRLAGDLALWAGLVGLTVLLAWPALWSAPSETLAGLVGFVEDNTDPRHAALGEAGAAAGAWFYPAAFLLRTTPLALVGLLLLGLESALAVRRRERPDRRAAAALGLGLFALLFGLAMTLAAKSFDRYLLPAFPALDLLAGLGLSLAARRLRWVGGAGLLLAWAFILPLLIHPLASTLPYALTWYNPLAGGGPAAVATLNVGWGEGLDQVARFLNGRAGQERPRVGLPGEIYTAVLAAQLNGQVVPVRGGDPVGLDLDYLVVYIREPRGGEDPPVYDARFQTWPPELVVRMADLDYAGVYDARLGVPLGADFGSQARLEGYGLETLTTRPGRTIGARLFWRPLDQLSPEARVVLALRDSAGAEVARGVSPLGTLEGGQVRDRVYSLTLPSDLPPGEYLLWAGLESADGQPLRLAGPPAQLASGAPADPYFAVLRSLLVRPRSS